MSSFRSQPDFTQEPLRRFYPPQGMQPQKISNTECALAHSCTERGCEATSSLSHKKSDDATYLMHRHPMLLQRLYSAMDTLLLSYPKQSFLYDACPDYLSLRLLRDRFLRENSALTEEFLHSGLPIDWLNVLTDTILSELLCRSRRDYRKPMGDASTTSLRSVSLSK